MLISQRDNTTDLDPAPFLLRNDGNSYIDVNLTAEDLEVDSPYNTRKNAGLPPGPISSPGAASIRAVANPASSKYLYYLHDEDGEIHYAETLLEHEQNIANFLSLSDERINAIIPIREFKEGYHLFMGTKKGLVKKVDLNEFANERKSGKLAITLKDDELIDVLLTDGNKEIIIGTKNGLASRFKESDVRVMGRMASGVRGIKLDNDEVVSLTIANEEESLLTVTEDGYGKRTKISEYRLTGRAGKGVTNIKNEKIGKVVSVRSVKDNYGLIMVTAKGNVIRMKAKDVSLIGRATQGVRLIKLHENDKVVSVARVYEE